MLRRRPPFADERGVAGGAEVLAFGFLTFVIGALLIANAWAILDAKIAVTAAAREATRAYVEAPSASAAVLAARQAASATMTGHGRDAAAMGGPTLAGTFARCARITATVSYTVPGLALPWIDGLSATTVTGTHTEIVDPYRSGLAPIDPRGQEPDCA